jgi:hypothetical protein
MKTFDGKWQTIVFTKNKVKGMFSLQFALKFGENTGSMYGGSKERVEWKQNFIHSVVLRVSFYWRKQSKDTYTHRSVTQISNL